MKMTMIGKFSVILLWVFCLFVLHGVTCSTTVTVPSTPSVQTTEGREWFWCYECDYKLGEPDASCITMITDPANDTVLVKCDGSEGEVCYTSRRDYVDTGDLYDMARGCAVGSRLANGGYGCTPDADYETCTTSCGEDYCNDDSGMPTPEPQITTDKMPSNTTTEEREWFWCYACTYLNGNPDASCVFDPANDPFGYPLKCNGNEGEVCYTSRRDYVDTGDLHHIVRGCEVGSRLPSGGYGCTPDAQYEYCITSCREDYCNDDSGMPTPEPETTTPPMQTAEEREWFWCYECAYTAGLRDDSCVTDPASATFGNPQKCNGNEGEVCYTLRREDTDTGHLYDFTRGCEMESALPNDGCTLDAECVYCIMCITSCQEDYCNDDIMPSPNTACSSQHVITFLISSTWLSYVCAL